MFFFFFCRSFNWFNDLHSFLSVLVIFGSLFVVFCISSTICFIHQVLGLPLGSFSHYSSFRYRGCPFVVFRCASDRISRLSPDCCPFINAWSVLISTPNVSTYSATPSLTLFCFAGGSIVSGGRRLGRENEHYESSAVFYRENRRTRIRANSPAHTAGNSRNETYFGLGCFFFFHDDSLTGRRRACVPWITVVSNTNTLNRAATHWRSETSKRIRIHAVCARRKRVCIESESTHRYRPRHRSRMWNPLYRTPYGGTGRVLRPPHILTLLRYLLTINAGGLRRLLSIFAPQRSERSPTIQILAPPPSSVTRHVDPHGPCTFQWRMRNSTSRETVRAIFAVITTTIE